MRYRIEYADGRCGFADSRTDLVKQIGMTGRIISDIRKVYKSGVTDSVMEAYRKFTKV